jgi:hypothetical protein
MLYSCSDTERLSPCSHLIILFAESPPPGYMSEDGDSQAVGMYSLLSLVVQNDLTENRFLMSKPVMHV